MNTKRNCLLMMLGLVLASCPVALAKTVYVDKGYRGNDSDGSKEKPYTKIQDAVDGLWLDDGPHEIRIKTSIGGGSTYRECVHVDEDCITFRTYKEIGPDGEVVDLDKRVVKVRPNDPPARAEDGPGDPGKPGLLVDGTGQVKLKNVKFTGQKGQKGKGRDDNRQGYPGGNGGPGIKLDGATAGVTKSKSPPKGGKGGEGASSGRFKGGTGGKGGEGEVANGAEIENLGLSSAEGGDGGDGGDSTEGEGGDGGDGGTGAKAKDGGAAGSSDSSRPKAGKGGEGGAGDSRNGNRGEPGQRQHADDESGFFYVPDTHFEDDFEGHELGTICTGGAWEEWEGSEEVCGTVTDEIAYSGLQSLRLDGITGGQGDDTVQRFGSVGGVWDFKARIFVPDEATGQAFVILLNQYPAEDWNNWSLQIMLDADDRVVMNRNEPTQSTPMVTGVWAELSAHIDLDNDVVEVTYEGDTFVTDRSWRDGVAPGGEPWIQAIDLYAGEPNGGGISEIFFDDVSLILEVFGACCVEEEGSCEDLVLREDCAEWGGRFSAETSCPDLDPPCGESGGCVRDPQWECDGDVDGDGQVNPVDSGLVQAKFGSTSDQDLCNFDVDCDGQINPVDAGIVQSLFGTCEPARAECP